jgi:hypothetical protein
VLYRQGGALWCRAAAGFEVDGRACAARAPLTLQSSIRSLLESEKRACDLKQNAFDRRDDPRVVTLNLFAMAKYSGRKPARAASVSGPSSALEAPR